MKRWIAFRARVKESRVVLEGVDLAGGHRVEKAVECLRFVNRVYASYVSLTNGYKRVMLDCNILEYRFAQ